MAGPSGGKHKIVTLVVLGGRREISFNLGMVATRKRTVFTASEHCSTEGCGCKLSSKEKCPHCPEVLERKWPCLEIRTPLPPSFLSPSAPKEQADEEAAKPTPMVKEEAAPDSAPVETTETVVLPPAQVNPTCAACNTEVVGSTPDTAYCPGCKRFHEGAHTLGYKRSDGTTAVIPASKMAEIKRSALPREIRIVEMLPPGFVFPEERYAEVTQLVPLDEGLMYSGMVGALRMTGSGLYVIYATAEEHAGLSFKFEHAGLIKLTSNGKALVLHMLHAARDVLMKPVEEQAGVEQLSLVLANVFMTLRCTKEEAGALATDTPARLQLSAAISDPKAPILAMDQLLPGPSAMGLLDMSIELANKARDQLNKQQEAEEAKKAKAAADEEAAKAS